MVYKFIYPGKVYHVGQVNVPGVVYLCVQHVIYNALQSMPVMYIIYTYYVGLFFCRSSLRRILGLHYISERCDILCGWLCDMTWYNILPHVLRYIRYGVTHLS
jgi:hypothetical protein